MAKYKYVDGVKYRVVPQSVLGYALVREGSDNSLPAGGTEGQVLTKASDTDYDVEWSTVEGGGGSGETSTVIIRAVNPSMTSNYILQNDLDELVHQLTNGAVPILTVDHLDGDENLAQTTVYMPTSITPYTNYYRYNFSSYSGESLYFRDDTGEIGIPQIG